ncbi:NAD(P)-binding protein, partial [Lindgomyces ingoldianus]
MSTKAALVIRATGSQGVGVTRHLLRLGWKVHAFVTNPEDPRALALESIGATPFKGTLGDASSIEAAIRGCNALFLNQMPSFADDAETREASSILSIAKAAGVEHVVHSTTLPLNDPEIRSKIGDSITAPAVFGKGDVEQLVQNSTIPWTIIRPGYFMTNLIAPVVAIMFPEMRIGKFLNSYDSSTILPLVDPDDIGAFAAAAFQDPQKFRGQIVSVAGEKLSIKDIIKEISRAAGKDIEIVYRTKEETEAEIMNPLIAGQTMSNDLDRLVDIEEVGRWGVPLTS